jgi:rod shape-determining protein MreC
VNLWDRIRDWVVLLALLLVSLVFMLSFNEPAVRSFRATALEITARIEDGFAWAGGYFRALDENNRLRQENIQLSSELARLRQAEIENDRLTRLLSLRDSSVYDLLAVRIISKDLRREHQYFTIDAGATEGIEPDMAVIDERGVLGKVVLVSDNFARVMSYLNIDFRTPARIQRLGADGIVRWEGERQDRLLMEYVMKTVPVRKGDYAVTSGFSAIFPSGYPIGRVDSVIAQQGQSELLLYLSPFAPLYDAEHAFVVLYRPPAERLELEQATR